MVIHEKNQRKYIKKLLIKITRYFYTKWYMSSPLINKYTFNINDAVYEMGGYKMEKIKQYVYENAFTHENLWLVYEVIKDYKNIVELLIYLSPRSCHSPEHILLNILRYSSKIRILNTDIPGVYRIFPIDYEKIPASKEEIIRAIKTFIRSYILLIFDIDKTPRTLTELYQLFIREEISYSTANEYMIIDLLMKERKYEITEIISLISSNSINTPEEIFIDIIKNDYNRFYRMIDDYYGSKGWSEDERLKACIKLYDIYLHEKESCKAESLGDIILENLDNSRFSKKQKSSLRRIILRNKERLNYGV